MLSVPNTSIICFLKDLSKVFLTVIYKNQTINNIADVFSKSSRFWWINKKKQETGSRAEHIRKFIDCCHEDMKYVSIPEWSREVPTGARSTTKGTSCWWVGFSHHRYKKWKLLANCISVYYFFLMLTKYAWHLHSRNFILHQPSNSFLFVER